MITTITVNYKTADYLERMLESLFRYHATSSLQVIVVENASGDDLSNLKKKFLQVEFLESKTNLGFSGGCNLGFAIAKGEFVILLNPDLIFTEPALDKVCAAMQAEPNIGVGGISLKNLDGSQQKCVWNFPTPLDQLLLLLKLPHLFPKLAPISRWRQETFDYTQDADVDQVMGAFFCIRRSLLESVGLFDEGFFLWYEEVDYCRRVVNRGHRVHYFSQISARHKKGSSFDRVETMKKQNILRRSIRRYMKKHFGNLFYFLFLFLEPLFFLLSFLASRLKQH